MSSTAHPVPARSSGLYGAVWRWHFYAGLFVVPFVIMLAVTGGAYLFKHEFEGWWHADVMQVDVPAQATTVPLAQQEAAILTAFPDAAIQRITLARLPDRANEWSIRSASAESLAVFVDPYTGHVTGHLAPMQRLMTILVELHGTLMIGRAGDLLIELAACWAFVLLVTGLYLWWPRDRWLVGVLIPRLTAEGRPFWRDLHAVPAAWNALFIAFLILSGLPWSSFWGDQLARLGTVSHMAASSPNFRGAPIPQSHLPSGFSVAAVDDEHAHHGADKELPWSLRHAGAVLSEQGFTRLPIAAVEARIRDLGLWQPGLRINYPTTPAGTFRLGYLPDQVAQQRTVYLDQYSGAALRDVRWSDYSPVGKATEFGVSVHMGREYGRVNQFLGLVSCVLLVLTAVTGVVLWWRRRPSGRIGAPAVPKSYRTTMTVLTITVALGIVFPLVGISLVVLLCLDRLVLSLSRPSTAPR